MLRSFLFVVLLACATRTTAQQAIGQWRDHLPYLRMVDVAEGGGLVYCATSTGLFSYDPLSGEMVRINKTNALSDVDIRGLKWNEPLQTLLIYYGNGNLDLLRGTTSFNLGDIERSAILGNKAIYGAHCEGTLAYLACGFGIVVVDLERREVKETWFIGPNGQQVQVNGITFSADSIYAATSTGLFTASRTSPNLSAFTNWRKRTDMGTAMSNGPFTLAETFGGKPVINFRKTSDNNDTLLVLQPDNTWQRFSGTFGRPNFGLSVSEDGTLLVVAHEWDIHTFNLAMEEVSFTNGYDGHDCQPAKAKRALTGAYLWVADRAWGLAKAFYGNVGNTVRPNGPLNASCYRMDASGGTVVVATGGVEGNWTNKFLKDGVHFFSNEEWRTISKANDALFNTGNSFGGAVNDVMIPAVDPNDPAHAFVGTWDDGLIEFRNGATVANYTQNNSSLGITTADNTGKVNIAGLDFDAEGNLWVTNAWATSPVSVRTAAGSWYNFTPGSLLNGNLLIAEILAASNGYKWIVRPRGNALLLFNDGGTITDTGDDQWKLINNNAGSGGLPAPDVFCVAEDEEGQIWVGTTKGVAVFYTPASIFSGDTDWDAQQILIEQDGNVQILLETESVSAIVVDGANRKWIGTQTSGAFLVSADGREQIHHFTQENSPLPSNNITSIAIDGKSGEVFFGTDRGIIGFRGEAIDGGDEATCAKVFPNPVRESYTGPIAVTGLVRDSEVKITDVSGNLVYRTTSLGGQAIWNGNDMSGNRAATGVYLIFATDLTGAYKCNTKVMLVR
ncbi:MAG: hypothetical protein IPL52_09215 [Flavobacteriales bacterium]|nr:hypothetical protein [Flavobacteriales bacterium]